MVQLKPGARFQSSVCDAEVIVVRGAGEVDLTCGGAPMGAAGTVERSGQPTPDAADGVLMGKRYVDDADSVELLVTKAGAGSLAIGGSVLGPKEAKPLPASD